MDKTITEWFNLLQPIHKSQAIANMNAQFCPDFVCDSLYEALYHAFIWAFAAEKREYWAKIAQSIDKGEYKLVEI